MGQLHSFIHRAFHVFCASCSVHITWKKANRTRERVLHSPRTFDVALSLSACHMQLWHQQLDGTRRRFFFFFRCKKIQEEVVSSCNLGNPPANGTVRRHSELARAEICKRRENIYNSKLTTVVPKAAVSVHSTESAPYPKLSRRCRPGEVYKNINIYKD